MKEKWDGQNIVRPILILGVIALTRFGFYVSWLASLLCAVALVACIPDQATFGNPVDIEQTLRSPSPNIAALQASEKGQLGTPAFVEFYTNDCAICRRVQGSMRTLDLQFDGRIKFIYVDIDLPDSQPHVRAYNVRGIPTFVLLNRHGNMAQTMPGWPGEDVVARALDDLLKQE